MKNRHYFALTNFSSYLAIFIGVFILIVGIVSMPMYYSKGDWNLVYTYYSKTAISLIPALVLTIIELVSSIVFILLGIFTIKKLKTIKFNCYFFSFFSLYFLVVFFVLLGLNIFDYFTIQTFAYIAYFVILAFIAISYWFQDRKLEAKLISHKNENNLSQEKPMLQNAKNQEQVIVEEEIIIESAEVVAPKKTRKPKAEEPSLKFEFVEPTLNDKTEEEQIEIKKAWEKTAEKLNALKYIELKKIAEDKGIQISGSVKKVRLVDLLKKIVKIYVQREDLTNQKEIDFNEKKMWMFTLVELKNIARKEEISIFSNANKVDYINLLKDKIHVTVEFTV